MTLSEELIWRGFANQTTYKDPKALDGKPVTFYWGVDPSADSMTVGNLATAMMVKHFISHGHKAVLLVGGATGLIGDPDGKGEERELKTKDEVAHNKKQIAEQYKKIFEGEKFEIVDNYDWFKGLGYLDFLREVGKHVPMRQMLSREFVETRLGEDGAGISYAEFSYSLIQGYDFLHLHRKFGVDLQVCGSDQWGNSIAGVELIRRVTGDEAHIWSAPLIINKTTGVKFGKSEDGAIWLDENKTSVYKFYQFWLNLADDGAADYLKVFTMLDKPAIEKIVKDFRADKSGRAAQKTLAYEVTKLIHGQKRADSARNVSEVLFGEGDPLKLDESDVALIKKELPSFEADGQQDLAAIAVDSGLATSKSEANRFISSGAFSINGQKVATPDSGVWFQKGFNLLKRGKNSFVIVFIK